MQEVGTLQQDKCQLEETQAAARLAAAEQSRAAALALEAVKEELSRQCKETGSAHEAAKHTATAHAAELQRLEARLAEHVEVSTLLGQSCPS